MASASAGNPSFSWFVCTFVFSCNMFSINEISNFSKKKLDYFVNENM
jgi:hypothetical protein